MAFPKSGALVKNLGVQLFSLPRMLEKNFRAGIGMLAGLGYREVELYGPYHFSAESAITRWREITPQLGFKGSGFFGHTAKEIKNILKENKMRATAMHTDLDTLQNRMGRLGEAADILGVKYVGLPAIPENLRTSIDDYKRMADEFNTIGEAATKAGLKFAYHNHGYGLQEMDGKIPLQVVIENTDPKLVFLQMDLFWTVAGGADPVSYIEAYPDRYRLMHIKDMKELKRFSGDGGSPGEWMSLFPYMTSCGSGVLDLGTIIATARKNGVKHFYVEQDMVRDPQVALGQSFDYLKSL